MYYCITVLLYLYLRLSKQCYSLLYCKVHATDVDSPPNAGITYYIVGGDLNEQFHIEPVHGTVHVKQKLDRESVSITVILLCYVPHACLLLMLVYVYYR